MILLDVNVLVHAHREDSPQHPAYRTWLEGVVNGLQAFAVSDYVLSGFVRVVTHPRVFSPPSTIDEALTFARVIRSQPHCVVIGPGPRHWDIFIQLCRTARATGNLVPDAWLAAMAIESGSEWITTDHGFSRFPGLRWRHPLTSS